jgi:urease accessory protein
MTTEGLYRLLAWASPAFPTGGFSYSHGLETAAEEGAVHDRATLERWITAVVVKGSGRIDADILHDAYRAVAAGGEPPLVEANRRGCAYRATSELALESGQQGAAFRAAYEAAWTVPHPPGPAARPGESEGRCHSAAFAAAAAGAGIALGDALLGYLQAFAANLMSAGLRLGIVGQSDGQRILAALAPAIAAAAEATLTRDPEDFGSASFAVDLASMAHETQYTRLFRS